MEQFRQKELCVLSHSSGLQPSQSEVAAGSDEHDHLVSKAMEVFGVRAKHPVFPGSQPLSIRRARLPELRNNYMVSLKSDGVRYALLLTRYRGEPRAVMIDRLLRVFDVEIWSNDAFFNDTMLDGELLWRHTEGGTPRLLFLAFDMLSFQGSSCLSMDYSDRVARLHSCILYSPPRNLPPHELERFLVEEDKMYAINNAADLRILPKRVLGSSQLMSVWEERHSASHLNDGLIFTPDAHHKGRPIPTFKWKAENTIDFHFDFSAGHGAPVVSVCERSELVPFASVNLDDGPSFVVRPELNQLTEVITRPEQPSRAVVLECLCGVDNVERVVTLYPIKHRIDKTKPNSLYTARETLYNVVEDVQCSEIAEVLRG
jgi:hypothetical protein